MANTQYDINNTIVAVSSPASEQRVIIRITGLETTNICNRLFIRNDGQSRLDNERKILTGRIAIDEELDIDARLYFFPTPNSYTGDDVAEIHIYTNPAVTEMLLERLVLLGLRPAEPGEFTARAYLHGKLDLAQAEAVNEIIVSSNSLQLDASEKLLAGGLSQIVRLIRTQMMDCLSLIEAGLDFSSEDIELITREDAVKRLSDIQQQLQALLSGGIYYESVVDLPAVGITGAPNAGKSNLLNRLLGTERSIVSEQRKTTRDILVGTLILRHCRCVLFDCAGLIIEPENILDRLAQQAAAEALRNSSIVIFCVDVSKEQWAEDISIRELIDPKILIPVATKCDLLLQEALSIQLAMLSKLFGVEFLATSARTGAGMEKLLDMVDAYLIKRETNNTIDASCHTSGLTITTRHRMAVTEAFASLADAMVEVQTGSDEIAAMMLRTAYQSICGIEQHLGQAVDEQVLERIFSRFCVGK